MQITIDVPIPSSPLDALQILKRLLSKAPLVQDDQMAALGAEASLRKAFEELGRLSKLEEGLRVRAKAGPENANPS